MSHHELAQDYRLGPQRKRFAGRRIIAEVDNTKTVEITTLGRRPPEIELNYALEYEIETHANGSPDSKTSQDNGNAELGNTNGIIFTAPQKLEQAAD